MTTHDDLDLLRRLKQLPREREPANDLWGGIAARIDAQPVPATRRPRRWMAAGFALAATVALVAVLATRVSNVDSPVPAVATAPSKGASDVEFVRLEAEALTLEYTVALEAFEGEPLPREFRAAAVELDDSARRIRSALRQEPDAVYLLDRLRRTYDQRLRLSQRALVG